MRFWSGNTEILKHRLVYRIATVIAACVWANLIGVIDFADGAALIYTRTRWLDASIRFGNNRPASRCSRFNPIVFSVNHERKNDANQPTCIRQRDDCISQSSCIPCYHYDYGRDMKNMNFASTWSYTLSGFPPPIKYSCLCCRVWWRN